MSGLDLAKDDLRLCTGKKFSEQVKCSSVELEKILREKFSEAHGTFVAWQIQSIVWGTFDGEKLLLKDDVAPNFDDWLELRIFNRHEEIHLKRAGQNFIGRYVRDGAVEETFYVDSFARLWGELKSNSEAWITLRDEQRKLSMTIPYACDDGGKKYYGLLTRNYIGSDEATGLSGYVDYRFVAIESAWDGD